MPHFALLNKNNIVIDVFVGRTEDDGFEQQLSDRTENTYKQTSYNTTKGQHPENRPFRKNYAGIGYVYDAIRDAFIAPKPFESWTLNEESCCWEAPVLCPEGQIPQKWDEENQTWVAII